MALKLRLQRNNPSYIMKLFLWKYFLFTHETLTKLFLCDCGASGLCISSITVFFSHGDNVNLHRH